MGILRLSHVEVRVPDLELATAYYTEVLGLLETGREAERVFLKCWDEHEHHSVILRYAATYGLEHMGFKVEHADDLELYEGKVEKDGGQVTRHARGELAPGHGEAIRFQTPTGHRCELVHGMEKVGNLLPRTNPPPRPPAPTAGSTISPSGSTTGTRSAPPPTPWPTTGCRSTSARPVTGPPAGTPSTSSIPSATATRCSPAATGSTPTTRSSPGPRPRWGGPSSTTRAPSTSGS